ncbi:MAG: DUF4389 domain-containing protein [Candidatus Peribacter sp.]|nr:DUF4389 domain-containing protein [Candidatus Peribacter sp.]MBT4392682.1 DUF4389 domain-containing protein [Candidatus Peribacter sp.]MBT4600701.1 DUF4389 domain-containing protein [Candidatus Peribacter sp.]MBT5148630.1 DUF4389 domain-containing protein [Candidatus Peribacter sp.]MBT5637775.1 DUF4389 domain-containing protein [Candidatus Peribacter sp.]
MPKTSKAKSKSKKPSEKQEAVLRIPVGFISGLIVGIWKMLITVLVVIHFFWVLFTGKRSKDIAEFCEPWNTQCYILLRYITFVSNEKPFPFTKIPKNLSKFS